MVCPLDLLSRHFGDGFDPALASFETVFHSDSVREGSSCYSLVLIPSRGESSFLPAGRVFQLEVGIHGEVCQANMRVLFGEAP
jgi:hypothetical protein